uniref:Urotensin II-related peptide n=1 Tax=Monopterus albus TaxID=43700 RepID=A0A3Q3K906_MONAL
MLNTAALLSVLKVVVMMLMMVGMGMEAAPTKKEPPLNLTYSGVPSRYLKHWHLSTKSAGLDGTIKTTDKTTIRTITAGIRARRLRITPETAGPDKQAQMMKMISDLEELQRTLNSTLSSRIAIIPQGGRNAGRKPKMLPAAEGEVKPTTAPPATSDSTAPRASADVIVPSLTGRYFRKSLPPKPNKRVCFWKYCSQN